jgi:hypothetical protein
MFNFLSHLAPLRQLFVTVFTIIQGVVIAVVEFVTFYATIDIV